MSESRRRAVEGSVLPFAQERELGNVLFRKPYVPPSEGRAGVGPEGEDGDVPEVVVKPSGNEFACWDVYWGVRRTHEHWEKSIII